MIKKNNFSVLIFEVIVIILALVGITFAITYLMDQIKINTTAANLGVTYTGNLKLPSTSLYPIADTSVATNTENVMKINFTVKGAGTNPTDRPIIYDVILSDLSIDTALRSEYLKWQLKKNGTKISEGSFAPSFDIIKDNKLWLTTIQQDLPSSSSTADSYEFILWLSESCSDITTCTSSQDQSNMLGKSISGKIETVLYTNSKKSLVRTSGTLSSETLNNLGLSAKEGTPDFTKVATTDEGIYSAPDDYGTSYYFRGAVTNNYVKFANKFWRIVRINGDGSIRMIYDGTTAHNNGESSTDRQIGTSAFNSSENYNAYVGYKYGTPGSSSYATEHANTNNSMIKNVVDNWYKTNILDKGFGNKIADVIYCNDRSIDTTQGGSGTGSNVTDYGADYRLYDNNSPKLTCPQQNDAFTVDNTTKGNGTLIYPVGLITADEVSMAGVLYLGASNNAYYLHTGQQYWTMSPAIGNSSRNFAVNVDGPLYYNSVATTCGVRPVLSLKSSVKLTGTGTKDDPFTVQ